MLKRFIFSIMTLCASATSNAQYHTYQIKEFDYLGAYPVSIPYMIDNENVNKQAFDKRTLLQGIPLSGKKNGEKWNSELFPQSDNYTVHVLEYSFNTTSFTQGVIDFMTPEVYQLFVDGTPLARKSITLEPGSHKITVKYMSQPGAADSLKLYLTTTKQDVISPLSDGKRLYSLSDVMHGKRFKRAGLSPDGKYMIVSHYTTIPGGAQIHGTALLDNKGNTVAAEIPEGSTWMPKSNKYFFTRYGTNGKELVCREINGKENVIAENLPEGDFTISPSEDYLIFNLKDQGPDKPNDIFETYMPDDRQPGWRDRSYFAKYDLNNGSLQRLVYGYHNSIVISISEDGKKLIFCVFDTRITKRPFDIATVCSMDMETLKVDTIIEKGEFISNCILSPDGKKLLISGCSEAFGGIGMRVKEGQIPNMLDTQLYMMDLGNGNIIPLTADFDPNVQSIEWNAETDMIYFTAENRDYVSLYSLNPQSYKISKIHTEEDVLRGFDVSDNGKVITYWGEGPSNSSRMYTYNTANKKTTLTEDINASVMKDIALGECYDWNFMSSRGDSIYGRFYLPPNFDASKKYPLIVNYYGGCSPTSRDMESRYPLHTYAALGYVVYVLQPSGATGFGQEFAARHVNTFGDYVADDIIEGTKQFCKEHPYVNADKIGCIGASYGGFMTQYLQTKTDIFAAGISHAGISNHASYWGEGYWGYSYCAISAAESYPWNNPELFTTHSPLFNADKVHTPLLFLHGSDDNNVPVGESIQMFTALKMLGRETAFVTVNGQDHHINDYNKRIKWQKTIFAWFAKWLQDDPTWWESMYPSKNF